MREVLRVALPVVVPGLPEGVDGLLDVRGQVVAVIDLAFKLGLGERPLQVSDHLILVSPAGAGPSGPLALRVEEVTELAEVAVEPATLPGVSRAAGVARLPDGLVVIHDLEGLLSTSEAALISRALEQRSMGPE